MTESRQYPNIKIGGFMKSLYCTSLFIIIIIFYHIYTLISTDKIIYQFAFSQT